MNVPASFKGAVKSKTVWAAAALGVLSQVAPAVPDFLASMGLSAPTVQKVGTACAFLMLVLRAVTTQSLADKGSPDDSLPPPQPGTTQTKG